MAMGLFLTLLDREAAVARVGAHVDFASTSRRTSLGLQVLCRPSDVIARLPSAGSRSALGTWNDCPARRLH
jgi:hypothetical protein